MKPKTRIAVAAAAAMAVVTNITVSFLFDPPWVATGLISLVASSVATRQVIQLMMEKRNGKHRRTEADTPDPETSRTTRDYTRALAGNYALTGRSSSAYASLTRTEAPKDELERVESDMPILAHRSAGLRLDGTSKYFGSVAQEGSSFGVDAEASCTQWATMVRNHLYTGGFRLPERHNAPDPSCSCGFYALPTDLAPTYESPAYVTLMVELSGTVIEHDRGYRAEHQRVVECQIQPCVYCGAQADLVVVHKFAMEQATCAAHKPVEEPGLVYLDVDDLAALLPVPVTRTGRRKQEAR